METTTPISRSHRLAIDLPGLHRGDSDRSANRLRNRQIEAANQAPHRFSDDKTEGIGAEHRHDRCRIEAADNECFEYKTQQSDEDRCGRHTDPNGETMAIGEIRNIGTEQHELALGKIEDAHHARYDSEAQYDQDHDRAEAQNVECRHECVSHMLRSTRTPSQPVSHLLPVAHLFESMGGAVDGGFLEVTTDQHQAHW